MTFEVNRRLPVLGLYRLSTRSTTRTQHRARLHLVDRLVDKGEWDTLAALRRGALTWADLEAAHLEGRLFDMGDRLRLRKPLWETVDDLWGGAPAGTTAARYRVSFRALRRAGVLDDRASVGDLDRVDWVRLAGTWPHSGSDWNHLRRAVSKLLSVLTYKGHPFWAQLRGRMPIRPELVRMPRIQPAQLAGLLDRVGSFRYATAAAIVTGWSVSEFGRVGPDHLGHYWLTVPGEKNQFRRRGFPVDPRLWSLITSAVGDRPTVQQFTASRYARGWRRALKDACTAAGVAPLRLHDLRHLTGQWAKKAGATEDEVAYLLGHSPLSSQRATQRYTRMEWDETMARRWADYLAPWLGLDQAAVPLRRKA